MGFGSDWKDAKKHFEQQTGKKKPSDKVLGVFRKGTGIEAALEKLEKGLQKKLPLDELTPLHADFERKAILYQRVLNSSVAKEDSVIVPHLRVLFAELDAIRAVMKDEIRRRDQAQSNYESVVNRINQLIKLSKLFSAKVAANKNLATLSLGAATAAGNFRDAGGYVETLNQQKHVPSRGNFKEIVRSMEPWLRGRTLNGGTPLDQLDTKEAVKRELGEFAKVIMAAEQWIRMNS